MDKILKYLNVFWLLFFIYVAISMPGCSYGNGSKNSDVAVDEVHIVKENVHGIALVGINDQGQASAMAGGIAAYNDLYKHFSIGRALIKSGKYDDAKKEFMMLIDGVNGKKDTGMGHQGLLELYEEKKDYANAVMEAEYAVNNCADFAKPKYEAKLADLKAKASQQG